MAQKYVCPVDGCDREAIRVYDDPGAASYCEEAAIPQGKTLVDMPRTSRGYPLPLAVQRNILVECPVHGRKYIMKRDGHHVNVKFPLQS